jgi:hypothetical protein
VHTVAAVGGQFKHQAEATLSINSTSGGERVPPAQATNSTKQKKLSRKEMFRKYGVSKPIYDKVWY